MDCDLFNLEEQDSFRFYLFVEDIDYCNITSKDTLTIDLLIEEPINTPPAITFESANQFLTVDGNEGSVTVGDPIVLNVLGQDIDPDVVSLELIRVEGDNANQNFRFHPSSGFQIAFSQLIWSPSSLHFHESPF